MRKELIYLVMALAIVSSAMAMGQKDWATVRQNTEPYHDVQAAEDAGYTQASECVSSPEGAMGFHYVNFALTPEQILSGTPNALLYAPTEEGLRLTGVEYVIPADAVSETPSIFGQEMELMQPHEGLPFPHYELHVWLWQANPNGMFNEWNPNIVCPAPQI